MAKRFDLQTTAWWGTPRKFNPEIGERRVSWLELFYDLVYVIAISRITHYFAHHISLHTFLEFTSLFMLIYWGWLNGSLYHDLHGSEGLRTRLMTLWQMMIIAALAITIDQLHDGHYEAITVVLMIMQLFITYLWWSVGIYDKDHRRYNRPYTIYFLISFGLMGLSIFIDIKWLSMIVPAVLLFNYLPPFLAHRLLRKSDLNLSLSSSMFERLGLFTIIVFGEVVLGVVNGISTIPQLDVIGWLNFALSLAIVFALWWIFFTLISNREVKKGFVKATLLELLFIPTLIALVLMAAGLSSLFEMHHEEVPVQSIFALAIAIFILGIHLMMGLLEYPQIVMTMKKPTRISLLVTTLSFVILSLIPLHISTTVYLAIVMGILALEILFLNAQYYTRLSKSKS